MKKHRLKLIAMPLGIIGLSVLLDTSLLNKAAFGAMLAPSECMEPKKGINFDVIVKNEKIGNIIMDIVNTGDEQLQDNDKIIGCFNVTKNNWSVAQLASDLGGNNFHFNWFQVVLNNNLPRALYPAKFIDPRKGGQTNLWADDIPWYLDEVRPPNRIAFDQNGHEVIVLQEPLTVDLNHDNKWQPGDQYEDLNTNGVWDPAKTAPPTFIPPNDQTLLQYFTQSSQLKFEDTPKGANYDFATFLIGDFGDKTYDIIAGFEWSATVNQLGYTRITPRKAGATFTADYAQRIQNEFGYTKVLKLPTYTFDGSLTPGEVNSFTKSDLPANAPFLTWTDNLPGINPPKKPDTVLRTLDGTGKVQRNYNNDGGPLGSNKASGLDSSVNLDPSKGGSFFLPTNNGTITENKDGIINLEVTGSADLNFNGLKDGTCDPQPEQGNYKLFVKLYENSFYPGGGVFSVPLVPSANTDCVKTEIITIPPNLPPIFPPCNGGSGGSGCSTTSLLANRYSRPSSVPEPTAALGLLALGTWGAVQGLKISKFKR